MAEALENLNNPWLLTVWPGMGSVAMLSGSHLAAALEADLVGELPTDEFFEVQHVEVKDGLARAGRQPRHLLLLWRDPKQRHDLIICIGEAQPPRDGFRLCRRIAEQARQWGVQRVTTFAAMATQLEAAHQSDVLAVSNDQQIISECREHELKLLKQGQVSGLNGLMLAAAAEVEIPGLCLMGEMPYFAVNVPNPPASLAVLQAFAQLAGIEPDLTTLEQQSEEVREQLKELVERLLSSSDDPEENELGFTTPNLSWQSEEPGEQSREEPDYESKPPELDPGNRQRIETLFEQVKQDRSQAVKLKRELDRLGVFEQYEDRFLDLFRKGE